jgi:hypothetical protein
MSIERLVKRSVKLLWGRGGRGGGEGSYGGELSLFIAAILIVFLVA